MPKDFQMDLCHGPLASKIVRFSVPLMLTFLLSIAFNAIDLVVIGNFSTSDSMAAIGATLSYNAMLFCMFFGLTTGSNVVVARYYGAGDKEQTSKAVHTSMVLAVISGLLLAVIGISMAEPVLRAMATPESILPRACTYISICLLAVPFVMIYSFGCTILRAVGNTVHPLIYLVIAGTVNVLLNLFFVICLKMDVAGVAIATAVSHFVSAVLVIQNLCRVDGPHRLYFSRLRPDRENLREILRIGIPASIQSSCFGLSNMILQSSINGFGAAAIAGTTAAIGLEGVVQVSDNAFYHASVTFVSQNYGAKQYRRILQSVLYCYLFSAVSSLVMGGGFCLFAEPLLRLFNPDPEVIRWGVIRVDMLFTTFALCCVMDVASAALRGIGYSMTSTVVTLFGVCAFRILWVFTVFPRFHTMENLLLSYPISWTLVWILNGGLFLLLFRKEVRARIGHKIDWSLLGPGLFRGTRAWGEKR